MPFLKQTFRIVDGERIPGTWRSIFINNGGTCYLAELTVYADGIIDAWGLMDFATFRQKVASGWITVTLEAGRRASAHHLGDWKFDEPHSWLTPDMLIAEVADEIEHLAGRPTSSEKCRLALERYVSDPSVANLAALHDTYFAVPEHLRIYLLGDMDAKDIPLRILITPIGQSYFAGLADDKHVVDADQQAWAMVYFQERRDEVRRWEEHPPAWRDDRVSDDASIHIANPPAAQYRYLTNDFPAPIAIEEGVFSTVEHAYWALAARDEATRDAILQAPTGREARKLGETAELRPGWNTVRVAVMLRLVRAKFRQHPDLAAQLVATGDGRIFSSTISQFWGNWDQGRNWLGRILEVVRAEIVADSYVR